MIVDQVQDIVKRLKIFVARRESKAAQIREKAVLHKVARGPNISDTDLVYSRRADAKAETCLNGKQRAFQAHIGLT